MLQFETSELQPQDYLSNPVCFSGGVDSCATAILALEHHEPCGGLVCSLPFYDNVRGIPFESPDHVRFLFNVQKPYFEKRGLNVVVIRNNMDFLTGFHHIVAKPRLHAEHEGLERGFPLSGCTGCYVKRDGKMRALDQYLKKCPPGVCYIGYAADEHSRLEHLRNMHGPHERVSLLKKYGYTHDDCLRLVKERGLLSPCYDHSSRSGCFGCPNARFEEHEALALDPETRFLWEELLALEARPCLANGIYHVFKETLRERDQMIRDRHYL